MNNSTLSNNVQGIQAYFSHSYRADDRDVNLFFWRLFSKHGFYFTVDPKSERTFVPHLERMMRLSDCFIAVVPQRLETLKSIGDVFLPEPHTIPTHSPYIEFESRLSERENYKPRLVFVESGLDASLFGKENEFQFFDRNTLDKREEFYDQIVAAFVDRVLDYRRYASRQLQPTGKAGILIDTNCVNGGYSPKVVDLIQKSLRVGGYTTTFISPKISDDRRFIRDLADVELIISEVRKPYITSSALGFIHAKALPSIRLCYLESEEDREQIALPDFLATGYTVGDIDPLIAWRTQDELVWEIMLHLRKIQQTRTLLGTFEEGQRYFLSAGRRSAKVFVSNAHALNNLALELVKGFQTVNIQFFQYQASMRIGSAWQEELKRELNECEVFVALISDEYHTSRWCQYELEYAFKRWQNKEIIILPYLVTDAKLPELIRDHIQCAFMHGMESPAVVKTIVETVDKLLTESEQIAVDIRDRVVDFDRALERTAIVLPPNLTRVAEETVFAMTKTVDIEHDSTSPIQLIDGMCRVNVNVRRVIDLPDFPEVVPVLFSQASTIENASIEVIKQIILKEPKRIVIIVLPSDEIKDAQIILDARVRKAYACDVVLLRHSQLKLIMRDSNPNQALKKAILAQVNILNYSPFVITGPTPDHIFFGREAELREITEHALTTSYAIIGGRRVGKTSILRRLHHVHLHSAGFYTFFYDCSTVTTCEDLLNAQIQHWQPKLQLDASYTIGDLLKAAPVDKPRVLLLDEVDKIVPIDQANSWHFLNTLRALANSGHTQIVFTGERVLRDALRDPSSPLFNFPNEVRIGCLDYQAVEELITQPMRHLEIDLPEETTMVHRIYNFTSGHPNIVQRLCRRLVEQANEQGVRRVTLDNVNSVICDPGFQRDDFLSTYWEAATTLEKIISLLLTKDRDVRTLQAVRHALAECCNLHPKARDVDDALQRLVDLRSLIKRTPTGYEFAVEAFPRVVAGTMTLDDMLEILTEEYQERDE